MTDPSSVASAFLPRISDALSHPDPTSLNALFAPADGLKSCYLRDLLVFGPRITSRHNVAAMSDYLKAHWDTPVSGKVLGGSFHLCTAHGFPALAKVGSVAVCKAAFDFETERGACRGYVNIALDGAEGEGRLLSLCLMLRDWKGHEEHVLETQHVNGTAWRERRDSVQMEEASSPEIIVVGAGQAGLQSAARLKRSGFRVLLIDKDHRVGDLWRYRYPSLTLHATKRYCEFLYMPYPETHPLFIPGSVLADWLELYARLMDLTVWTNTTVVPGSAMYDKQSSTWTVKLQRGSESVVFRPQHIVWATGQHGAPNIPDFPASSSSTITLEHSSSFADPCKYVGRKVLVVGAATSALDIAQSLHSAGIDVTVLQRSSTAVVSIDWMRTANSRAYPDGIPMDVLDERANMQPVGMSLANSDRTPQLKMDGDMLKGLESVGFEVNDGPGGSGQNGVLYERFAGFYVDVGCAALLTAGKIKLEHGSIKRLDGQTVELSSGRKLETHHIILATGFQPLLSTLGNFLGTQYSDKCEPIWGLDEHGEIRVGYGSSGCPGLSIATGTFPQGRFYSKFLALYLRALSLGYILR